MSHFISSIVLIREISYIININSVVFTWLLHRVQYYSYNICWLVVSNCFIFHNIWDNHSHWLSYFSRWLKTTNQYIYIYMYYRTSNQPEKMTPFAISPHWQHNCCDRISHFTNAQHILYIHDLFICIRFNSNLQVSYL